MALSASDLLDIRREITEALTEHNATKQDPLEPFRRAERELEEDRGAWRSMAQEEQIAFFDAALKAQTQRQAAPRPAAWLATTRASYPKPG